MEKVGWIEDDGLNVLSECGEFGVDDEYLNCKHTSEYISDIEDTGLLSVINI